MNEKEKPAVPVWYWIVATVALLWNLMGCGAFAMEVFAQEAMMETFSEEQKEWARSTPPWIYFVYGVAVTTGVAGSVALFLRKGWSVYLFVISLAAVITQMVYTLLIAGGLEVMGPSGLIMPALIIGLATASYWYSSWARNKGWLVK